MNPVVTTIAVLIATLLAGILAFYVGRASKSDPVPESEADKQRVMAAARTEAETIKREAEVLAKEAAQKIRAEADADIRGRRQELEKQGAELVAKGQALDRTERELRTQRDDLGKKEKQMSGREQA